MVDNTGKDIKEPENVGNNEDYATEADDAPENEPNEITIGVCQ